MSIVSYAATTLDELSALGPLMWMQIVATKFAEISEGIVRGLGSAVAGDLGVPAGQGFHSVFRAFVEWASTLSSAKPQ